MSSFFLKMGQIRPLFVYFHSFRMTNIAQIDYNDKSVDGVLGTRTRGSGMIGPDKPTELWRPPPFRSASR